MPMQFIQDPNGPRGMGRVVDPASGLDRVVYDPSLAETLEAGAAPSPEQAAVIDNAANAPPPPKPANPAAQPPGLPGLPTTPGMPPPVTEQAAEQWAERQAPPAPQPIVRASGNPQPPAPAPDGTVLSKAKIEMGEPGYTYDKVAEEQRGEVLLDQTLELQRRADAMDVVRNEQQIELQKQRDEAKRREAENAQKSTRYERELETTVKREINQDRLEENKGLFGSILGLVGQTLGYLATPDSGFGRLQASLDRRVQRDIAAQKEAKESTIKLLTKQLGSAQQAENHYRAQVYSTTANILETKLQRLGVADQYADKIQGLRDNALAYNEAAKAASFGKPGQATYEYERPTPAAAGGLPAARVAELSDEDQQWANDYRKANKVDDKEWKAVADFSIDESDVQNALTRIQPLLYEKTADGKKKLRGGKLPGFVAGQPLASWLASDEGLSYQQALTPIIRSSIKATSGTAASDKEVDRIVTQILGDGSFDALKRGLEGLQSDVTNKRQAIEAAYPASAKGQKELRRRAQERSRATNKGKEDQDAMTSRSDENVVASGPDGKKYYESPEAKRSREAREKREAAAKNKPKSDYSKISRLLELD